MANAGAIKAHATCRSRLVKTEVESLAFKKREDIVEDAVVIRKVNHRPRLDGNNVRIKAFVLSEESGMR